MQNLGQKMGPGSRPQPQARLAMGSTQKLGVHSPDMIEKNLDHFGQKKLHFRLKILHFLRYTYETPIFSAQTDLTHWEYISLR